MAIAFVNFSSGGNAFFSNPGTVTVPAPASIVSGNLLLAVVAMGEGVTPDSISPPSGWALLASQGQSQPPSGGPWDQLLYYKVAGASEPATYSWTVATQTGCAIGIAQYSGTNAVTPFDGAPTFSSNTGGNPAKPATFAPITPNFSNDMYVAVVSMPLSNMGGLNTGPTDGSYTTDGFTATGLAGSLLILSRLLSTTSPVQCTGLDVSGTNGQNVSWSILLEDASPLSSIALEFIAGDANVPTFSTSELVSAYDALFEMPGVASPSFTTAPGGFESFVISDANVPTFSVAQESTANPFNLVWALVAPTPTISFAENTANVLPAVIAPIVAMMQYTPVSIPTYVARLIAFTLDFLGNAQVIDVSGPTWSGALATYTNAGPVVGGTQFSDSAIFAMGLNIPPQLYRGLPVVPITNTFQSNTNYPPWLAGTQYPRGSKIVAAATPDTGIEYIFNATHPGTSGTSAPSFPSTFHGTVNDNGVVWRNIGAAGPPGPLGAAFVFNHLNSLWVWGTAPTYPQTGNSQGLVGPDGLWMSDEGNPTSYDPANTAFIGQGDGQAATGGGVWTQLEVGIPATPQLVLFKSNQTYSVLGAFPAISIAAIPDGVGCAAPNTTQFVPGIGLMRLANPGVAVFNGTRDVVDQYTDPIRPYLFPITGANPDITPVDWGNIIRASSTQTVNPPGYLLLVPLQTSAGALTRGFFFDRQLRAWTVIDYPVTMPLGCGFYYTRSGQKNRTLFGGFSDGIIREGFTGDEFWDTAPNQPIPWSFRYPPSGAPATPIYVRRTLLRAVLRGSVALIRGMRMLFQDANGKENATSVIQSIDANNLSSSFDIDTKVLGGYAFDIFGSGRILAQGLEVQYSPKAPTRIPQ